MSKYDENTSASGSAAVELENQQVEVGEDKEDAMSSVSEDVPRPAKGKAGRKKKGAKGRKKEEEVESEEEGGSEELSDEDDAKEEDVRILLYNK